MITLLLVALAILAIVTLALGVGGGIILIFADVLVAAAFIYFVIKFLIKG